MPGRGLLDDTQIALRMVCILPNEPLFDNGFIASADIGFASDDAVDEEPTCIDARPRDRPPQLCDNANASQND
jgi:hypothetical protein